ncbi:O-antigen ligase family protein [Planctomycetota bacterium]
MRLQNLRHFCTPVLISTSQVKLCNVRIAELLLVLLFISAGLGPLFRFGDLTVARIISLCLILILLPRTLSTIKFPYLLPAVFGYLYGCCLFFHESEMNISSFFSCSLFFGYGLMAMVMSKISIRPRVFRWISFMLISIGFIAAISAIFEYVTGFNWYTGHDVLVHHGLKRPKGLHSDPNATADFILIGLVSAIFACLGGNRSRRKRIFALGIMVVCAWGFYVTASRGAVVALFLGVLPIFLCKRICIAYKYLLLICLILFITNYHFVLRGREFSLSADGAGIARVATYHANLEIFLQNPIIGDQNAQHFDDYGAHNNLLEVMSYGGMISALPFIFVHILVVLQFWKKRHIESYVFLFSLFLIIAGAGLSHTSYKNVIFWCIIGLCLNEEIGESPALNLKKERIKFRCPTQASRRRSYAREDTFSHSRSAMG